MICPHRKISISYIFQIVYLVSSFLFLINTLFFYILKNNKFTGKYQLNQLNLVSVFFILKEIQPNVFSASIILISVSGIFKDWFLSSLLMQRFSVPEFRKNKIQVHIMLLLGLLCNVIFMFFGLSTWILSLERENLKIFEISINIIIFISFLFLNSLYALMTLIIFRNFTDEITTTDKMLQINLKIKKHLVYLNVITWFLYISFIIFDYKNLIKSILINEIDNQYKFNFYQILYYFLLNLPYFICLQIYLLNLTYYSDLQLLNDNLNIIPYREFFLENEDTKLFMTKEILKINY